MGCCPSHASGEWSATDHTRVAVPDNPIANQVDRWQRYERCALLRWLPTPALHKKSGQQSDVRSIRTFGSPSDGFSRSDRPILPEKHCQGTTVCAKPPTPSKPTRAQNCSMSSPWRLATPGGGEHLVGRMVAYTRINPALPGAMASRLAAVHSRRGRPFSHPPSTGDPSVVYRPIKPKFTFR
jgi:hypothetical protein